MVLLHGFTLDSRMWDSQAPLGEVKAPTLVIVGALDQPPMLLAAEEAAKPIPGARTMIYAGVGHMLSMEQPDRFNRDLDAFLSGKAGR